MNSTASLEQLKTSLSDLPEAQRVELAKHLLASLESEMPSTRSGLPSFFAGITSVLEIFPSIDRLHAWRIDGLESTLEGQAK